MSPQLISVNPYTGPLTSIDWSFLPSPRYYPLDRIQCNEDLPSAAAARAGDQNQCYGSVEIKPQRL